MGVPDRIGLIAGSGQFPLIFAQKARQKGIMVYAAAHINETQKDLADHVDAISWVHLGQIKKILKFFKQNGIKHAVMMGAIKKTRMFSDVRPDTKAIGIIAGMRHTHDDGLLSAFARVFENEGITIKSSTFMLPELLAEEGCWTKRTPSRAEQADIDLGWDLAKEIGRLDIGQCLVIGSGTVLAVEAVDGTDATILRGGKLGNGNAVVVKICKPNQDQRFDIPAIGLTTIENMHLAGATVLAVEAGKALVFDKQTMIELADKYKISIIAKS